MNESVIGMAHAAVYDVSGLQEESDVSPPREARATDATKLTLPVVMVIAIVGSSVTTTAAISTAFWVMQAGQRQAQAEMQSDLRDMRTRFEMQERIGSAEKRADTVEREAGKQAIDSLRGVVQLLQLQVSDLVKQRGR